MAKPMFSVVQPWGKDRAREATVVSSHAMASEAFEEIDRLSAQMVRTGAPSDAVEFIVIDAEFNICRRTNAN